MQRRPTYEELWDEVAFLRGALARIHGRWRLVPWPALVYAANSKAMRRSHIGVIRMMELRAFLDSVQEEAEKEVESVTNLEG